MKRRGRGSGGKRTRGEKTPHRLSPQRSEKIRILIVCEGRETEPNYFRGLRDEELVLPASRRVLLGWVKQFLGAHEVRLADEEELSRYITDCEVGAIPALRH